MVKWSSGLNPQKVNGSRGEQEDSPKDFPAIIHDKEIPHAAGSNVQPSSLRVGSIDIFPGRRA